MSRKNEVTMINNNATTNFVSKIFRQNVQQTHKKSFDFLHERDRDPISVQLNNRSTFCRSVVQLWFCPVKLVVQLRFSAGLVRLKDFCQD
jgi:hypothetical protein